MKKKLTILGAAVTMCLVILLALYAFSPMREALYRGSFKRNFSAIHTLRLEAALDLKYNSFYFAGVSDNAILLGNSTAPFLLLRVNPALNDSQHIRLRLAGIATLLQPRDFRVMIDSPFFFMTHSTMGELFRGHVGEWTAQRFLPGKSDYFADAVPIGASSFVLRSYSKLNEGFELAKKTNTTPFFRFSYDLLNKQVDGVFCLDGQLLYSKALKRIIYLHFYRNEVVVADTNLNLIRRACTIDTMSRARIKVSYIDSGNERTLAQPPVQINLLSAISGDKLFVRSNIMAGNEDEKMFRSQTVVDVYAVSGLEYLYSFYIPPYRKIRATHFHVLKNQLAVLYGRHLVVYTFNQSIAPG